MRKVSDARMMRSTFETAAEALIVAHNYMGLSVEDCLESGNFSDAVTTGIEMRRIEEALGDEFKQHVEMGRKADCWLRGERPSGPQ